MKWLTRITLALLLPVLAHAQSVDIAFQLPSINGIRRTYAPENVNVAPVWANLPAEAEFTKDEVGLFCLHPYATDDNDEDELEITQETGTLQTGLTFDAGCFTGTPTVAGTETIGVRLSDGTLHDDASIDVIVSEPPALPDTTPDAFSFTPQSGVTRLDTITSDTVTVAGINAAATVSVSNGLWNKNGGSFVSSDGTVVAGDQVRVRHTAPNLFSTATVTTLTIGGVAGTFTSTTEASPARQGVLYRLTGSALSEAVNLSSASWPVSQSAATDGVNVEHLGETENGAPSNVRALSHFEIKNGSSGGGHSLDEDGKWFRGTIYPEDYSPDVDYGAINGGGQDKPRVNLNTSKASKALHNGSSTSFHYRVPHRLCFGIRLPAEYIEDNTTGRETILQVIGPGGGPDNSFDLSIQGGPSGASWVVERKVASPGSSNGSNLDSFSTLVTNAMKGSEYTIHSFYFNIDNRTSGGSPVFQWVVNVEGQPGTLVANSTARYGFDETSDTDGWAPVINLPYKPAWHGEASPGAYEGNKADPIVIDLDGLRVTSSSGGFSDCHPERDAKPSGAT